jgi:hypothetical protein
LLPAARGEPAVPTSRAFNECASRVDCRVVSEFRTTRTYHENGTLLEKVAVALSDPKLAGFQGPAEAGRRRVAVVRGLLWCGSTSNNARCGWTGPRTRRGCRRSGLSSSCHGSVAPYPYDAESESDQEDG